MNNKRPKLETTWRKHRFSEKRKATYIQRNKNPTGVRVLVNEDNEALSKSGSTWLTEHTPPLLPPLPKEGKTYSTLNVSHGKGALMFMRRGQDNLRHSGTQDLLYTNHL